MHVIYVAPVCSEAAYRRLASLSGEKLAYEVQKYHRLFAEGLAANAEIDVISGLQLGSGANVRGLVRFPDDTEAGVHYHYPAASTNSLRKMAHMFFGTVTRICRLARRDSVIMVDCLSLAGGAAAALASMILRRPLVSIITDLPDMFEGGGLLKHIGNFVIRRSSGYIVLTAAMEEYIRTKLAGGIQKPFVVLEGQADSAMRELAPVKADPAVRVCLYAGRISALYGLRELVEGFCLADLPDTELHLYGSGDYTDEVERISAANPKVRYGGVLFSDQVVRAEQQATLLVNPRPSGHVFVKYSFPSKTMEYMSTGTPVLMTELPCLPEEYKQHLLLIRDESARGIADALREAFSRPDEELAALGIGAREFILRERNNVVQAEKAVRMCADRLLRIPKEEE